MCFICSSLHSFKPSSSVKAFSDELKKKPLTKDEARALVRQHRKRFPVSADEFNKKFDEKGGGHW